MDNFGDPSFQTHIAATKVRLDFHCVIAAS
jgi:hypothetical protein